MVGVIVGVDVSKRRLDVVITSKGKHFAVSNDQAGLAELAEKFHGLEIKLCVLEATGGLEQLCVVYLQSMGIAVSVVNPRQARDFAKAVGKLSKTDKIDAKILALFGERLDLRIAEPVDVRQVELSSLASRREQLVQMRTAESNRLGACRDTKLCTEIIEHIAYLDARISKLDSRRGELINGDVQFKASAKLLETIPGVGRVTSASIIADLPEIHTLGRKELASLVGVAPHCRDSGQSRGQRAVWGGRANVRSKLYMAALVATQHNPLIRDFYQRLIGLGKKKKVALVACMHKLLGIMRAVLLSRLPWDREHHKCIDVLEGVAAEA